MVGVFRCGERHQASLQHESDSEGLAHQATLLPSAEPYTPMTSHPHVLQKERSSIEIDPSTPVGRSRERFRRIGLTSAGSLAARGIGFATSFITVPLTLHYLGSERYGLWATLSSVIALASFADFGLGNGLLNALSGAHGRDDRVEAAREVSTAFLLLLTVAAMLGAAFLLAYPHVHWARVYNVTSPKPKPRPAPRRRRS